MYQNIQRQLDKTTTNFQKISDPLQNSLSQNCDKKKYSAT